MYFLAYYNRLGFAFFAEPSTASFYKRFVRDFLRYKDSIQCAAHSLVAAVRAESLKENPDKNGEYFALHIRRGDLQFKVRVCDGASDGHVCNALLR